MSGTSSSIKARGPAGNRVHPAAAVAIVVAALGLCVWMGMRYMAPQTVPTSAYINAAKHWIEQPEREKLKAQGMAQADVDQRIKTMWDRGELKLPPGEPGVDWAGTPNGIIQLKTAGTGKAAP